MKRFIKRFIEICKPDSSGELAVLSEAVAYQTVRFTSRFKILSVLQNLYDLR